MSINKLVCGCATLAIAVGCGGRRIAGGEPGDRSGVGGLSQHSEGGAGAPAQTSGGVSGTGIGLSGGRPTSSFALTALGGNGSTPHSGGVGGRTITSNASGTSNAAGASGSGSQSFVCIDVGRPSTNAALVGASGSGSPPGGGIGGAAGGVSLDIESLPALPEGHHVTLRPRFDGRDGPALAVSGSVLGLAFQEGNRLRFGVNADQSQSVAAWSFVDVAEIADAERGVAAVAGGEDGFDVAWTVAEYWNSEPGRVLSARFDSAGRLVEGPFVVASGSSFTCGLAKSRETVALACAEGTVGQEAASVWIQLCPREASCVRCTISSTDSADNIDRLRPSLVWDGGAFNVVFAGGASEGEIRLTRVDSNGKMILEPLKLFDVEEGAAYFSPAVALDGKNLVVAYGHVPTVAAFDTEGTRVQGPWVLSEPSLHDGLDYQVLPTTTGYAVLTRAFGDGELAGVHLWAFDRRTPDHVASTTLANWGADASAALLGGEITAVHAGIGGRLTFGRFEPNTLTPKADPEFIMGPPGMLFPVGVHCDPTTCYVLAHEPDAANGSRIGVWQVARTTGKVTAPARLDTAPGMPLEAPVMRAGRSVAVVVPNDWRDTPNLVFWSNAVKSSSHACPVAPSADEYHDLNAFLEGSATRIFYVDGSVDPPHPSYHRLLTDGQFGTPVPTEYGSVRQCGNVYVKLQGSSGSAKHVKGLRWRPGVDSDFLPLFETQFTTMFTDWCCSDSIIAVTGEGDLSNSLETAVYSLEGQLVSSSLSWSRQCASAGESLLLWPNAEHDINGYRIFPDGTLQTFNLVAPSQPRYSYLAGGSGPWVLEATEDVLALAWNDENGGAFLSLWRLPGSQK